MKSKVACGTLLSVMLFCGPLAQTQETGQQKQSPTQGNASPDTAAGQLAIALDALVNDLKAIESDPASRKARVSTTRIIRPIGLALTARVDHDKAAVLSRGEFAKQVEEARTDKQVSSTSSAAASTSLITKGTVPEVLGLAVENGAATQTQSGTTITFRANPVGVVELLAKEGYLGSYDAIQGDASTKCLSHLSFAVSFDASRGNNNTNGTAVLTGDRQQLSAFTVHYDFINKRDPRDPYFTHQWQTLVSTRLAPLAVDWDAILTAFLQSPVLKQWDKDLQDQVATAQDPELETVVAAQFAKLQSISVPSTTESAIKTLNTDYANFIGSRSQLLKMVARGPLVSAEYTDNFSASTAQLPDLSAFQLIAETGLFGGQADLTANFTAQVYNNASTTAPNRLKDIDFSAEIEIPLSDPRRLGNFTLSGAYKYRNILNDTLNAPGGTLIPKGVMSVGQVQLSIPIKGSGVKVPISFTVANRSEFVKESDIRGNFGITFDMDTILAALAK